MKRKLPSAIEGKAHPLPTNQGAVSVEPLAQLPIALLSAFITPDVMEAVRKRLKLTPEKLTLMLVRLINPDEILEKGEEAIVRGVSARHISDTRHEGLNWTKP